MRSKLLVHLRRQWMGALALFLVLTGGVAYAANTVRSTDIVDNEVRTADVRNDTLTGGGLAAADLKPSSVGTSEAANNSLTGADINESSLDEIPSATLGGLGGRPGKNYPCDPESTEFIGTCASAEVDLAAPSRVLVIGQIRAEPDTGNGNGGGSCKVSGLPSPAPVFVNGGQTDVMTISGISDVLGPGTFSFGIVCNETASGIGYFDGNVSVVALSPGG